MVSGVVSSLWEKKKQESISEEKVFDESVVLVFLKHKKLISSACFQDCGE